MHTRVAVVIEHWLNAPQMQLESLQATSQFGKEFEQACKDTPLDGVAIRNQWIPFRHGMHKDDDLNLRRLAWILREDSTFTLAKLHIAGGTSDDLVKASKDIPGCVLSNQFKGVLLDEAIGN
ncbi:hypothetical protein [Pseudomonas sp. MWU318]|uniref:hypothetical protein n=1 Tax=Pseudomonas sp. MWU318 TaxID=2802569 RepID=UPI0019258336|nr:hypothetical protein [Pseudomonas sp. MWU318]